MPFTSTYLHLAHTFYSSPVITGIAYIILVLLATIPAVINKVEQDKQYVIIVSKSNTSFISLNRHISD